MKLSILTISIIALLPLSWLSAQNSENSRNVYYLEKEFGDTFIQALYSIDETRPFSIIQIDKVSIMYSNKWISPDKIIKMLTNEDKKYLVDEIINYLNNFDNQKQAMSVIMKLKSWSISNQQIELIADKMEVGRQKILAILKDFYSGYVNQNTGQSVDELFGNDEQEYYMLINFLSQNDLKEQFKIYSKLFNQLSAKK